MSRTPLNRRPILHGRVLLQDGPLRGRSAGRSLAVFITSSLATRSQSRRGRSTSPPSQLLRFLERPSLPGTTLIECTAFTGTTRGELGPAWAVCRTAPMRINCPRRGRYGFMRAQPGFGGTSTAPRGSACASASKRMNHRGRLRRRPLVGADRACPEAATPATDSGSPWQDAGAAVSRNFQSSALRSARSRAEGVVPRS